MSAQLRGILLAAGGAVLFSFDGLLVRLQSLSPAGVVFWRSVFSGIAFVGMAAVAGKAIQPGTDAIRRSPVPIALITGLMVVGNTAFVFSLTQTSIAQTLVIVASVPIATGILGHFVLREYLPLRTWLAGAAALSGVVIVVWGSLGSTHLLGDIWALCNVTTSAVLLVGLRRYPNANRLFVLALSALVAAIVVAPWASPIHDLKTVIASAVDGLLVVAGGLLLVSLAPRYLPAAVVGLFLLLETILGPLWVLVALGEAPTPAVVLSAGIILGAIAIHSWLDVKETHQQVADAVTSNSP